jgi:hypothetical protein
VRKDDLRPTEGYRTADVVSVDDGTYPSITSRSPRNVAELHDVIESDEFVVGKVADLCPLGWDGIWSVPNMVNCSDDVAHQRMMLDLPSTGLDESMG